MDTTTANETMDTTTANETMDTTDFQMRLWIRLQMRLQK